MIYVSVNTYNRIYHTNPDCSKLENATKIDTRESPKEHTRECDICSGEYNHSETMQNVNRPGWKYQQILKENSL